jgi:hypothetical protein
VPIAGRWLHQPQVPGTTAGMHRFVWDLVWGGSAGADNDAEADYRSPSAPKIVPGNYQVRLTVDGSSQARPLRIVMDPRSPATLAVLTRQFQLAKQMFSEAIDTRHALAEIAGVQKRLTDQQHASPAPDAQLNATLTAAEAAVSKIADGKGRSLDQGQGLSDAYKDLASALRVVESGDRETPAQAVAVYQQSSQQIKECLREWIDFKEKELPQINEHLRSAHQPLITPGESE